MSEYLSFLIEYVSPTALAVAAASVIVAGFLRGFVGFGGALAMVMILSMVLGPLAAVPISSLSGVPATLQLLPSVLRDADRRFVLMFGIVSIIAAPFGALVLVSADPDIMKMAISGFVLVMVVMLYRDWRPAHRFGHMGGATVSAAVVAGLIQGAAGVGGPPAVVVALARGGSATTQRANVLGAVTSLNVCAWIPFWYFGLYTRDVVVISLIVIPLYMLTTWMGARLFSAGGMLHYRNVALLTLAVIGVGTFAVAVRGYLVG
ncbi:MAG: hypothetical protein CMM47_07280 [Rhodospirillaceae bacterium]|nr:hypothetical protein [Rhodospirillaceae bacterium]